MGKLQVVPSILNNRDCAALMKGGLSLKNISSITLDWSASSTVSEVDIMPTEGQLAAGESVVVTIMGAKSPPHFEVIFWVGGNREASVSINCPGK